MKPKTPPVPVIPTSEEVIRNAITDQAIEGFPLSEDEVKRVRAAIQKKLADAKPRK